MEGMSYSGEQPIDLGRLRERLRKMTDEQLLRFGNAPRFMCREKRTEPVRRVLPRLRVKTLM